MLHSGFSELSRLSSRDIRATTIPSPLRHSTINQELPFLPVSLPFNDIHNRPRAFCHRFRTILDLRHRRQVRLREPRAKHESLNPKFPILPYLTYRQHILRRFRSPVFDEIRIIDHGTFVKATTDGACAGRNIDDARPERISRLLEERCKDFGDTHGPDDVGVEAGVHAFAAAFASVGYSCVVDYDVDVTVGNSGILASADDSTVFSDIYLNQFDCARESV